MARYVKDIVLNKPDDFVTFIVNDYLQKNKFSMADWNGEPAYRAGDAMIEGFKYLKWSYAGGVFHLEAWLKGTAGGEWDLDGVVGVAMKKPYKNSLEQLFTALQQEIPAQGEQSAPGDVPPQGQPAPQPIPVKTVDNTGAATAALVLGILSIAFGLFIPLIGIILGIIGMTQARMGSGSSKAGMAKAGKVLSIIGICIAAAGWLLNIVLTVAMF
ncbi:MAG TPA: hypothetical protein H9852_03440 [Candidatus Mediterraneibacter colneyensis]|nr:hypothetical protein [Candidatus Mediterraneibacter colneyensis]